MVRYRLNIAYDGTDFCGWQKQEPLAPADEAAAAAWAPDAHGISSEYTDGPGAERGGPDYRGVPRIESERAGRIALRTVQGVVERAVREVVRERVEVLGASRTDAGVHARGQVAAFTCSGERIGQGPHVHAAAPEEAGNGSSGAPADAEGEPAPGVAGGRSERAERDPAAKNDGGWPESRGVERLVRAINGRLPDDVIVTGASVAAPGFDPVFGAERKAYSYTLHVGRERPLWDRRFVHHVWTPLELERMREAASVLVGEHDFRGFAAAGHGRQTTVRTVFRCQVTEMPVGEAAGGWATFGGAPGSPGDGRRVRIEVEGSGFLWNMVRIIAGTLVEVGRGRLGMEDVRAALREGDRRRAGPTLAPGGLCLEWIRYADGGSDGPGRTGNTGPGGRAETHHEEPA